MSDERIYAFSNSEKEQECVDCGIKATRLVHYAHYSIGDLVCPTHADWRREVLHAVTTAIPLRVMIVKFDKGKRAAA